MSTSRGLRAGILVVTIYVATVGVTSVVRSGETRPLFDAFAPPSSYRFVDPPPFFAAGNVKPHTLSTTLPLDRSGSVAGGFATPDGQFVVTLAAGAVPPAADATELAVRVTPIDPKTIAPPPGGLRANGNAYHVELDYEPGDRSVIRLTKPGSLLVEIPEIGSALFVSPDGRSWRALDVHALPPGQLSLVGDFTGPGYFVAATALPELVGPAHGSPSYVLVVGVVTALLAGGLFAGSLVYCKRVRRRSEPHSAEAVE